MNEQSAHKRDLIREFCRSHGAPSADWLGRLSTNGQRECIRQWILRVMSPEIRRAIMYLTQNRLPDTIISVRASHEAHRRNRQVQI
jgi:hypothetical protein